eukprot:gnl/TRDRNA2_/TRDRNA2_177681_c1_seq3.p2 gnl/TRDRNA2_/TRDRNA2_177681_c1~~gnl/TRDRNA2_/TRDRNA2_177681_c1_seq3.p2  ORF type:complete len:253 (-),score=42.57 gnl/TRDRNA2_/TRDRNA2_177681_c1_seq3:378-1031(-)
MEELPRNARFGWKSGVLLGFLVGLGFVGLVSIGTMPVTTNMQEPSIDMAWPSMQVRPSQSMQSARGFRMNALPNLVTDVRETLAQSPAAQKCMVAGKHATVCGNLVLLRPSTALRAEADGKAQSVDAEKLVQDLKGNFDAIENKPLAALYAGGAVVALTTVNGILTSVDNFPLLPSLFETVGIGYSGWFAYRYLLTKGAREELTQEIDELKKKVSGE